MISQTGFENLSDEEILRQLGQMDSFPIAQNNQPTGFENLSDEDILNQLQTPLTIPERAGQVGRGAAVGTGNIADLAANTVTGGLNAGSQFQHGIQEKLRKNISPLKTLAEHEQDLESKPLNLPTDFNIGQKAGEFVDALAGRSLAPTDTLGKVLHGTGEFLTPIPGLGAASKAPKLAKYGKSLATALGASTAVHATPRVTKEGTGLGAVEDIAKAMFGANYGNKLVSKAALDTVKKLPKNIGKNLNPKRVAARFASMGAKPNKEILDIAAKEGIDLPINIGLNSKPLDFIQQNMGRSIFTSRVYRDAVNKSSNDMVNAVKKSIDKLGDSTLMPQEASREYKALLNAEKKGVTEVSNKLYEKANNVLKDTDMVQPKDTSQFIHKMKDELTSDIYAPEAKKVLNHLYELGNGLGIIKGDKMLLKNFPDLLERSPKDVAERLFKAYQENLPKVSVKQLEKNRKQLNAITAYGEKKTGYENLLNGLKSAIEKDMATSTNKEYLSYLKDAKDFFKHNIADRFRGDLARSLLDGEAPKEAFNQMNSVENIRLLKKSAGDSKNGKEIFNALSKAKARSLMEKAVKEEGIQAGNFSGLFKGREKNQEVLQELLGNQEFNRLKQISKITDDFSRAGREVLNTSGTSIAAHDLSELKALSKGAIGLVVGGTAGGVPGLAAAAAWPVTVNLGSRLMVDKNFIKYTREYALARAMGKEAQARGLLNRMVKISEPLARETLKQYKTGARQGLRNIEEEENE